MSDQPLQNFMDHVKTMTTYRMADGSQIFGEYSFVTETEFFDDSSEPTELIKETWTLWSSEAVTHIPPGWINPNEEDDDDATHP